MQKLKGLRFKAKDWTSTDKEVEGELSVRDYKTLEEANPITMANGYVMCIQTEDGFHTIVDPNTIELLNELSEDLQECEGCSGKWPYEKMESDSDGVPLCENCYDALVREALGRICKGCNLKGSEFKPGQEWVDDDFCSDCSDE